MEICKWSKKCGGCDLQGVKYEEQLDRKQKTVENLLKGFGPVDRIIGMKNPYNYRNKINSAFGYEKGKVVSGVYKEGTHQIVPVDFCQIQDSRADAIIKDIREMLKSFKIKTYNEDTGYGLLRHVMVRCAGKSGEVMVVLVLGSPILPSKNNFVKALRSKHPEISTVVINVNDKKTSMVLGDRQSVIYGKGYITDELCDLKFKISPRSFYQVNSVQTEVLYSKALELAELSKDQVLLDAYCGIGTIGMVASKKVKKVIGVELNKDAVRDAIENAKINNIKNIRFYNEDAAEFMVRYTEEFREQDDKVNVVVMDPPRAGSDERFISSVAALLPEKVVYISCNPETLARDLKTFKKYKYGVKKVVPVDMFPFTTHVETVVLMSREDK